ncbi:MAG: DUF58 domain-containing protein [Trueperaceae bacterium]
MLAPRTRALLDRYGLASRELSRVGGERSATEPGQSVEFHDYRAYQPGDELRYVDWRVYARTGRLYTRLYQAERSVRLHLVLDNSPSMTLYGKDLYGRTLTQLLTYVAQKDAPTQLHLLDGRASRPAQGLSGLKQSMRFIDDAGEPAPGAGRSATEQPEGPVTSVLPISALKRFAVTLPTVRGSSLVLVVSDLLEDVALRPTLAALRARGVDVGFLQVIAEEELKPPVALLELHDVESGEKLPIGAAEVEAYRLEVRRFLARTRGAILKAGYKHWLFKVPSANEEFERVALAALIRSGILIKR